MNIVSHPGTLNIDMRAGEHYHYAIINSRSVKFNNYLPPIIVAKCLVIFIQCNHQCRVQRDKKYQEVC